MWTYRKLTQNYQYQDINLKDKERFLGEARTKDQVSYEKKPKNRIRLASEFFKTCIPDDTGAKLQDTQGKKVGLWISYTRKILFNCKA